MELIEIYGWLRSGWSGYVWFCENLRVLKVEISYEIYSENFKLTRGFSLTRGYRHHVKTID